ACADPAGPAPPVCAPPLDDDERRLVSSPDGRFLVARQDRADGLSALRLHQDGRIRTLAQVNAERARFAWGELIEAPHPAPTGEALKSWLLLPPGLAAGARAPLVIEVYPGRVFARAPASLTRRSTMLQNNPAVISGGGYAVLLVSLPNPPAGRW